jgi:hypothetical protein
MGTLIDKASYKAVSEQFKVYGEYVNLHRHVPYVFDGLKPSYRRTIQSALDVAKDKMAKVATISGHCIGHYHPHGDASINPIVSQLVNVGIFEGQGNHGCELLHGEDQEPAAPRYIEAKLSNAYKNLLLPLLPFVPTFENELNSTEYEYLPVPIPLGLTFGYLGIAVGTGCRIPAFTPKSLLNAYLKDDPELLESSFGLIIENKSELKRLWETSRGRINYKIHTYIEGDSVCIKGFRGPLTIDWSWIDEMVSQGRVELNDLSSTKPLIKLNKTPRVQYPTFDEIRDYVEEITRGSESYYLRVVAGNQVRDVGIRDWIDITYKNYCRIYQEFINHTVSTIQREINIYTNFRTVADKIINTELSYEKISSKLGIDLDIVKAIGAKSINSLRNSDPSTKIPELKSRMKEVKSTNIDNVIKENIETM